MTVIEGRTQIALAPGPQGWIERTATITDADASITLGVSPAWFDTYGVEPGDVDVHATTNDVRAASVASCLTGVFAAALDARSVPVSAETLRVEVRTEMYEAARRALATYDDRSRLLSRTLRGSRCRIESAPVLAEPAA